MIETLYAAAAQAGFLTEAVWAPSDGGAPVAVKVDFRAPDEPVLAGLGLSTEYAIRYPASSFVGLSSGDTLTIAGQSYRVREVRALGDGSERRATLTRV